MTAPAGSDGGAGPPAAEDRGSPAQRDRRRRIIDACLALAAKGGYDAVQMRAVADRAGVALGTLYRYYPSKVQLLVSAFARELERIEDRSDRDVIPGATSYDRLMFTLGRLTKALQRDRQLTEALTRAFMFAGASAAAEVEQVDRLLGQAFVRAMLIADETPTEEQLAIADVVTDIWLANLVAAVAGRSSTDANLERLELAVRLLLGHRPPEEVSADRPARR